MQPRHAHFNAYLALLIILIGVAGFLYGMYSFFGIGAPAPVVQNTTLLPQNIPPPTPADLVSAQHSFQYLVSYTDSGFQPSSLPMKVGETVRFTNNSGKSASITGAGTGSSLLQHGIYWEYTPTAAGSFTFTAGTSSVTLTVAK